MIRAVLLAFVLLGAPAIPSGEPPQSSTSARVVVPAAVVFQVTNVGASTAANAPTTVSFDSATLRSNRALRISVRADGNLTLAGGTTIPASNVSWTTSNAISGVGTNGVLSTSVYTPVYQSNAGVTSGRVTLAWTLAAPGGGILAGTYQATLRWRFEVVNP